MTKRYYAIFKNEGFSDEMIRNFDQAMQDDMDSYRKEMRGQQKLMGGGTGFYSIEEMQEYYGRSGGEYEPPNTHYNLEDYVITKILIEEMYAALEQIEEQDRVFIFRCMSGSRGVLKRISVEDGIHINTVINRKNRIIDKLREIMKVEV